MKLYMLVAIFGAIGSVCRFSLIQITPKIFFLNFPLGTIAVNLIGSFLIGCVVSIFEKNIISEDTRYFIVFGFLGGFTTYSAFTFELFNLIKNSDFTNASIYICLTLFLGLALFYLGYKLFKHT